MFRSFLAAGFECGHLGWNDHDLLLTTGHIPEGQMAQHYRAARQHGLLTARDGLPWRHDIEPRLAAARDAGMQVIWDLDHYWRHPEPEAYIERLAAAALSVNGTGPLWVCPVNEPEIVPLMCIGTSQAEALVTGLRLLAALKKLHPNVRVLTVDAVPHPEGPWDGSEAFAFQADVIGINVYPHTLRSDIAPILVEAHRRFGKPVMISETSWHDGFHRWPGISNKADWLRFVLDEVQEARDAGVVVAGVCLYPIVDCPPWEEPHSQDRWSHGLIRSDLSVDPALSSALLDWPARVLSRFACD